MLKNPEQTIGAFIDAQKVAYIGSIDRDGYPNTKAMLPPRKREGIRRIYFSTNTSSLRVGQFLQNPKACLYFSDRRYFRGVLLRGCMRILQDPASKEMLWREGDTLYYPNGVEDPDYCVLEFTAESGRYYANFQSQDFSIACAEPLP